MVVFFQMDKAGHDLKRIQLERPRHGVNPPSFRAIAAALHADFGKPDQTCVVPVLSAGGYQAAAEERWAPSSAIDPASFRGLRIRSRHRLVRAAGTVMLLVRIGPPDGRADPCSLALCHGPPAVKGSPAGRDRAERANTGGVLAARSPGLLLGSRCPARRRACLPDIRRIGGSRVARASCPPQRGARSFRARAKMSESRADFGMENMSAGYGLSSLDPRTAVARPLQPRRSGDATLP